MLRRFLLFYSYMRLFSCLLSLWMLCGSVSAAPSPVWVMKTAKYVRNVSRAIKVSGKSQKLLRLGRFAEALPERRIDELSRMAKEAGGIKKVGQILGKENFIRKYGEELGRAILDDAYLRIAVKNGKISGSFAREVFEKLSSVPGLTSLVKKINSPSLSASKGHLRELELGLAAVKRGNRVVSFGEHFSDGHKLSDTDLDVLLNINGKLFAVESKAYAGNVPSAMIKADAESLLHFVSTMKREKHISVRPAFVFLSPQSKNVEKLLKQCKIDCFAGSPEEICAILDQVSRLKI